MPIFELIINMFSQVLYLSGFISGTGSFPPALSPEEEKKYLELLAKGDREARRILIEHNLRLVAHIAKKYSDDNNSDDFISIGTIGLIKGIDTYNPEKCNKLSSYISRCIENEVRMVLRKNKKQGGEVSIDEPLGTDKDGNAFTLSEILPADNEDICDILWARLEEKKLYRAMTEALTPTETDILKKRYGLLGSSQKTQKEVAAELGISRSYVSRIEKRCLKKLYDKLNSH